MGMILSAVGSVFIIAIAAWTLLENYREKSHRKYMTEDIYVVKNPPEGYRD